MSQIFQHAYIYFTDARTDKIIKRGKPEEGVSYSTIIRVLIIHILIE